MKRLIKLTIFPTLLLITACSHEGASDNNWRENPEYGHPGLRRDGQSLQMNAPRSREEYDAWEKERYHEYRKVQRAQQLQNRGMIDNSTDTGLGMGQPVSLY
ncbi:hypothetical protein ACQPT2_03105 [Erwinia amylovora]